MAAVDKPSCKVPNQVSWLALDEITKNVWGGDNVEPWEGLLDAYSNEVDILSASYEMMGVMLDQRMVVSKLRNRGISEVYIYGGGYLGLQFYRAVSGSLNIISFVDKSGELSIDISPNVRVIGLETFKQEYAGQIVVITPMKHYYQIHGELQHFVTEDKLLYLGELLGGIM